SDESTAAMIWSALASNVYCLPIRLQSSRVASINSGYLSVYLWMALEKAVGSPAYSSSDPQTSLSSGKSSLSTGVPHARQSKIRLLMTPQWAMSPQWSLRLSQERAYSEGRESFSTYSCSTRS